MAKSLKLNIKNKQLAKALNLDAVKEKLQKKGAASKKKPAAKKAAPAKAEAKAPAKKAAPKPPAKKPDSKKAAPSGAAESAVENVVAEEGVVIQERPRVKARKRSAFEEGVEGEVAEAPVSDVAEEAEPKPVEEPVVEVADAEPVVVEEPEVVEEPAPVAEKAPKEEPVVVEEAVAPPPPPLPPKRPRLGPTGRHIRDILPPPPTKEAIKAKADAKAAEKSASKSGQGNKPASRDSEGTSGARAKKPGGSPGPSGGNGNGRAPFKEFRDFKPKRQQMRSFDSRDRAGLRDGDDDRWRRRRGNKAARNRQFEETTIRPKELAVRLPITIKDLAAAMKLKAAQLISKLFMQGVAATLNDSLDDETTVQLLGQEFECVITIDTTEEERIRITDHSIKEEIGAADPSKLVSRAPVVAFMGHVDHGKTSLIDAIRKSNRAAGEAGDITQHIGAFRCKSAVGDISVLDTPGHEAFSAMRARGAEATDIVVLVIAGDEGIRQQTIEAIQHARAAGVIMIVAVNKSDKPGFDLENVHRQLADNDLLPEAWGGQTITVPCSASSGDGVEQLLEMLALQSEILELKANPSERARGTVLESEMHKGLGAVATLLVQNGTLRKGDNLVFGQHWGRVKTMRDEHNTDLEEAGPSTPVSITGLSGLPVAGDDFIAVTEEKEARSIAETRMIDARKVAMQKSSAMSLENLFQQAEEGSDKKILNIVLRADVQGSLEALKSALERIESDKVDLSIIGEGVGEISESDVQLAAASKAIIVGFHTEIESHAEPLIKRYAVQVRTHDVIYHVIDDIKSLMTGLLDKLAEEQERGAAEVKAVFKSSQLGKIAGCQVTEGTIHRNHNIRVKRGSEELWKGSISSLKRVQDDVREVKSGLECGIVLNGFDDFAEGDILEAFEVVYLDQEL